MSAYGKTHFPQISLHFASNLPTTPCTEDVLVFPAQLLPDCLDSPSSLRWEACIVYGSVSHMPAAFEGGCSDYLVEPWRPEELFFRALRIGGKSYIDFDGGRIEILPFALVRDGRRVELTPPEYFLLRLLAHHIDSPVPRQVLSQVLNPPILSPRSRAVDVHISALRKKLARCGMGGGEKNPIRSIRGLGYVLSREM